MTPRQDRFTKGELQGGENYADALEAICAEVGGDTIAAVIVEPMTGSGGVFASPANYLSAPARNSATATASF